MSQHRPQFFWVCTRERTFLRFLGNCLFTAASVAILVSASSSWSQIVTDGSVGRATSLSGPNYAIPTSLGKLNGNGTALLQSFSKFNLSAGQSATFTSTSARLKTIIARVTGGSMSSIDGALTSLAPNADLYFLNPNGVVIGPHASINVPAGFFVSTADRLNFADGTSIPISASPVGNLSAASVQSFGFLGAQVGDIVVQGRDAKSSSALGSLSGALTLVGGNVSIADTQIYVNATGAQSGRIFIAAVGSAAGDVPIAGSGSPAMSRGGNLVLSNAVISATNPNGNGGQILFDGQSIAVSPDVTLDASSRSSTGSGGSIRVTADKTLGSLTFQGKALARGGAIGGGGGTVETSGAHVNFDGAHVDTSAPAGRTGTWLTDPFDLTIDGAAAATIQTNLATTNVTLQTTATGTSGPGNANASGAGDITITAPITWSSANQLKLDAYHGINVTAPITVAGAGQVSFVTNDTTGTGVAGTGTGDYSFGLGPSGFAGNLTFTNAPGGGQGLSINGSAYTLLYSMSDLAGINGSSGNFALTNNLTAPATAYATSVISTFAGTFTGLGHTLDQLKIANLNSFDIGIGLIGHMGPTANLRDLGSELASISVTGSRATNNPPSVGIIVGMNEGVISNSYSSGSLSIDRGSSILGVYGASLFPNAGGLVGSNIGSIRKSNSSALVDSSSPGPFGFNPYLGGLVGYNTGSLSQVFATGSVMPSTSSTYVHPRAGGLAAYNSGTISYASATGSVSGETYVGGLVGWNLGTITNAFATGNVTGHDSVGGLVGNNDLFVVGDTTPSKTGIFNSYATGSVVGQFFVGGLAGQNSVAVMNSYAIGSVTSSTDAGGLVGSNRGVISDAYATGAVGGTSGVGGLVAYNSGGISNAYATGAVSGSDNVGGLTGQNDGTLKNAFYNIDTVSINGSHVVGLGGVYNAQYQDWLGHNQTLNIENYFTKDANGSYTVNTVSDLKNVLGFYWMIGLNFRLDNDIDLISTPNFYIPYFSGNFDGSGRQIQNFILNALGSNIGFIGVLNGGSLSNIGIVSGSVNGLTSPTGGSNDVGALVGSNSGTISNVYATISVSGNGNVGGLVGSNAGIVRNAYSTGAVSGSSSVGGLVGYNSSGISNAYATGSVSGSDIVGGLVGGNDGTLNNAFYNVDAVKINGSHVLGIGGIYDIQYQDWLSHNQTLNLGNYFAKDANGVYLVSTLSDLRSVLGFYWTSGVNFRLTNDIDLSPTPNFYIPYFSGNLDGFGHQIKNLVLNNGGRNIGFIGTLNGGMLSNLGISSGAISSNSDSNNVGALVGSNSGTINNAYSLISVSASNNDYGGVGGLVGSNFGTILNSYATGPVSDTGHAWGGVGGLVGYNSGVIQSAYATGAVSGQDNVGGLVGDNEGAGTSPAVINNAFATGVVSGSSFVGGLVGCNYCHFALTNSIVISNAYATGAVSGSAVSGSTDVGGLVGSNLGGINNAYSTGAISGSEDIGGLTGLNYGALTNAFYNIDVVSINGAHALGPGGLYSVQYQDWFNNNQTLNIDNYFSKDLSGSYIINSLSDLKNLLGFNWMPGLKFRLVNDIDLSSTPNFYIPYFSGNLDGTGHQIKNLVLNNTGPNSGFIGFLDGGSLSNLGIVSGSIFSPFSGNVGALVGSNSGAISNVYATISVFGADGVGGLVGSNVGVIRNAYATGDVGGFSNVGGLVGANGGTVQSVYSVGNVSGRRYVGGLIGSNYGLSAAVKLGYWDTQASGQTRGIDTDLSGLSNQVTGLTTAAFQSGSLPTGLSSVYWSSATGAYPILGETITGLARLANGAPASGGKIDLYVGGVDVGSPLTSSNGAFRYILPSGTIDIGSKLGATLTLAGPGGAVGGFYTDQLTIGANGVSGVNLNAGQFTLDTGDASYSALQADVLSTFGGGQTISSLLSTFNAGLAASGLGGGAALQVNASGAFTIDQAINQPGSIGLVAENGALTIASGGSVVSSAPGDAILLAANGSFINQGGSTAVAATGTSSRWLIYSQATGGPSALPTSNVLGGLGGKSYYGDAFNFSTGALATSPHAGNRFVYGVQPVLSVIPDTRALIYNGASQTDSYTVSGYLPGDQATDRLVGAVAGLTTSGKLPGSYPLTASGSLASDLNYAVSYGVGTLTISAPAAAPEIMSSGPILRPVPGAPRLSAQGDSPSADVNAGYHYDTARSREPVKFCDVEAARALGRNSLAEMLAQLPRVLPGALQPEGYVDETNGEPKSASLTGCVDSQVAPKLFGSYVTTGGLQIGSDGLR